MAEQKSDAATATVEAAAAPPPFCRTIDRSRPPAPCKDDENPLPEKPTPTTPYQLKGPQVEPSAAFWLLNPQIKVPSMDVVDAKVKELLAKHDPPMRIEFPTDIAGEVEELVRFAGSRGTEIPDDELSDFVNLQNAPFGAIFNTSRNHSYGQYRIDDVLDQKHRIPVCSSQYARSQISTRGEMSRMFENETPGLIHQNALAWLLYQRTDISPARHARVWMALNLAIYTALAAAWHYKWVGGTGVAFRLRPVEYIRDGKFSVLYDRLVAPNCDERDGKLGALRGCPCPSPGTPRHPAYPSGHSTYSAAASGMLQYFFADDPYAVEHLRRLANNIGEARIWAGVHWRSDHTFGQIVGRAVAEVIMAQLQSDCVPDIRSQRPCDERRDEAPPDAAALQKLKDDRLAGSCAGSDVLPPMGPAPMDISVF